MPPSIPEWGGALRPPPPVSLSLFLYYLHISSFLSILEVPASRASIHSHISRQPSKNSPNQESSLDLLCSQYVARSLSLVGCTLI